MNKNKDTFLSRGSKCLLNINKIKLSGNHNLENSLAALAAGTALDLDIKKMIAVLKRFPGLSHRCQLVSEESGIKWYNDSKATNIGATIASIEGLSPANARDIILIAGGIGKNADFSELRKPIKKHVKKTILFGHDAKIIGNALENDAEIFYVNTLLDAVKKARNIAETGNIVLFAPACSSFDMFKNFEHRGDQFTKYIKKISK